MRHGHRLDAVSAADERRDHLGFERAGAEERDCRDDVLEGALLEAHREVALAARLKLEHPHRVCRGDEFVDRGVIGREVERLRHRVGTHPGASERDRVADRRVHPETEDVHLHEAEHLDVVLVVLRDDDALGRPLERHPRSDRLARDDEAAEVRPQVHRTAGELLGQLGEQAVTRGVLERVARALGIRVEHLAQTVRAHPRQVPRERVHLVDRQVERAGDGAHGAAGGHRVDGGDHRDMLVAEALVDVLDHLVAAARVEVHVDVGHLAPLGVEEPLEEQIVPRSGPHP